MAARTIDPEQNWFFQQGFRDGLDGILAVAPDEVRCQCQRSDYYAGYRAGAEERAARGESETEEYDPEADSIGSWRDAIAELKRQHEEEGRHELRSRARRLPCVDR
jgi:hypothetical protein